MNTQENLVAQSAVVPENKLLLSPQDKTRVNAAIAFHINGHQVPKANTNGVQLYEKIHGELFLNNFYKLNLATINKLGQLPEFSFFRTIHDDLIGKKVTALLINGLLVTGYLGVNGYNGEAFDRSKELGFNEEEGLTYVRPVPKIYVKMNVADSELPLIEEIPFISIVAVNDRLPEEGIPVAKYEEYVEMDVPLIDNNERNTDIIQKHREAVAKRKEHDILAAKRRKKNLAERKARRNNRK